MKWNVAFTSVAAAVISFGSTGRALAQDPNVAGVPGVTNVPVVSVVASDGSASESGPDVGVFTVRRAGPTNGSLTVFYALAGHASNGLDYVALPGNVTLAAGVVSAAVTVIPIDDALVEGTESVELRLVTSSHSLYAIGSPSSATVAIADNDGVNDTNLVTTVTIVATDPSASENEVVPPGQGRPQLYDPAVFTVTRTGATSDALTVFYSVGGTASNGVDYVRLPGSLTIPAGASSAQIEVSPIDDFIPEPTESIIVRLEAPSCPAIFPPPPGCYFVGSPGVATAALRDNDTSSSNHPPVVVITSPRDGAQFHAPADILIEATTTDFDGYAPHIEFFANDISIGEADVVFIQAPLPGQSIFFEFAWTNVVAGSYTLTARASDTLGATGMSAPVHITVGSIEPTNSPLPIVNILAVDASASEGLVTWCSNHVVGVNNLIDAAGVMHTNIACPTGTNTARFHVDRSGSVSNALRVYYALRGTASNGVDYAALPGVVTIAAGERAASIVIDPIDDTLPEHVETVEVQLQLPPPGSADPPYQIGQRRAGAFILDNDQPPPPCLVFPDGMFHLCHPGTNGLCFRIEVTTNLVNWAAICTNRVADGAVHFVDPDARDCDHRFYRVIQIPCPLDAP